jgi:hypothetical protein
MSEPSTELCPDAIPLDLLQPKVRAQLAGVLGVADEPAALQRVLADEQRLLATLMAMSFEGLLVAEVIVEAGGEIAESPLRAELSRRHGFDRKAQDLAIRRFHEHAWFAMMSTSSDPIRILVQPAAETIARLVRGVSLPEPPPGSARGVVRAAASPDDRRLVALVAATAHVDLRMTAGGLPHHANVKKLAKRVGLEPVETERVYAGALRDGLFLARGRVLAPDVERLLARARSPRSHPPGDWIGGRWVSLDALARAWNESIRQSYTGPLWRPELLDGLELETIDHEGHRFVRRPERTRTGDGHVTPSFDVMLGPAADLEMVASVGLFAELTRVDHVLSHRVTRESVANAVALGIDADWMLRVLALVGPHGVPENVATTLRDFAASARTVELALGWHLVLPPGTPLGALEPFATKLGDGAYLLSPSTRFSTVEDALAKARVVVRPSMRAEDAARAIGSRNTLGELPATAARRGDILTEPEPPPLPLEPSGHAELRRRVRERRTAGERSRPLPVREPTRPHDRPPASEPPRSSAPRTPPTPSRATAGVFARVLEAAREWGIAKRDLRAFETLAALEPAAVRELTEFARQTGGSWADVAENPYGLMHYYTLDPRWRAKLRRRSPSVEMLIDLSVVESKSSRMSMQGRRTKHGLHDESFIDLVEALFEEVVDVGEEGARAEVEASVRTTSEPPAPSDARASSEANPSARAASPRPDAEAAPPETHDGDTTALAAPAWTSIPKLTPDELASFLHRHVQSHEVIAVALNESHDPRVRVVRGSTLQKRGEELALLAVDVVTDEARVIHARDVVGATVLERPSE